MDNSVNNVYKILDGEDGKGVNNILRAFRHIVTFTLSLLRVLEERRSKTNKNTRKMKPAYINK